MQMLAILLLISLNCPKFGIVCDYDATSFDECAISFYAKDPFKNLSTISLGYSKERGGRIEVVDNLGRTIFIRGGWIHL